MKIAARFPIKSSKPFLWSIIVGHLGILIGAIILFGLDWFTLIIGLSTLLSAYFSVVHYLQLTIAPDDLCWTGEGWLIHSGDKLNSVIYLSLQPSSWRSSFACLLHFSAGSQKFVWLFSRANLGDRGYSELCYLMQQNLTAQLKNKN